MFAKRVPSMLHATTLHATTLHSTTLHYSKDQPQSPQAISNSSEMCTRQRAPYSAGGICYCTHTNTHTHTHTASLLCPPGPSIYRLPSRTICRSASFLCLPDMFIGRYVCCARLTHLYTIYRSATLLCLPDLSVHRHLRCAFPTHL